MCSSSNKIKNPYLLFWYVYVPYPLKKFKAEFSFIVEMSFKYCFTLKLFFFIWHHMKSHRNLNPYIRQVAGLMPARNKIYKPDAFCLERGLTA